LLKHNLFANKSNNDMVKRQKFSKAETEDRWLEFLQRVYFSKSFTSTNFNTIDFSKIIGIPSGNLIAQLRENLGLSFIKCKIAIIIIVILNYCNIFSVSNKVNSTHGCTGTITTLCSCSDFNCLRYSINRLCL